MILHACVHLEMHRSRSGRQHCKLMALTTCREGDGTRTEKEGRGAFVSFSDLVSHCVDFSERRICVSSVQLKKQKE